MKYKMFCYICKKHLNVEAENKKEAVMKFEFSGHDNTKTNYLPKDLEITKLNYDFSRS